MVTLLLALSLSISGWSASAQDQAPNERVRLFADHLVHDDRRNETVATGRVRVVQSDIAVYAEQITYDKRTDTSRSAGKAQIVHTDGERQTLITCSRLVFNHKDRHLTLEGPVKVDRPDDTKHKPAGPGATAESRRRTEQALKAARTIITADKGEYWTRTKIGKFTGNVVILQREKKATAETATLDDPKNLIVLEDKAHVEQIKGNWLVVEGIVDDKPDDLDQQLALRRTASVDAKRIELYSQTNDMIATGDVVVEQKQQIAKSQRAVYRDADQLMTLTEQVRFERPSKDWLTCDRAVYDLRREVFDAFGETGQIASSIVVNTEPTPAPELPAMPPDQDLGPASPVPSPASGPPPAMPQPQPSAPPAAAVPGSDRAATGSDAQAGAGSDTAASPAPLRPTAPQPAVPGRAMPALPRPTPSAQPPQGPVTVPGSKLPPLPKATPRTWT